MDYMIDLLISMYFQLILLNIRGNIKQKMLVDFKQYLNLLLERIFISTVSMVILEILDFILVKV